MHEIQICVYFKVPTYPSGIKFRVCDDCFTQTMNKKSTSERDSMMLSSNSDSGSANTCMDWCLSSNAKKNEAVRAEFSYEFTPNVTLCLSIMKMHTINLDYPRYICQFFFKLIYLCTVHIIILFAEDLFNL